MIELVPMRMGEVAATAAVNIQTLRYYERVGLLPQPVRRLSAYIRAVFYAHVRHHGRGTIARP